MRYALSALAAVTLAGCASAATLGSTTTGENDVTLYGNIAEQINRKEAPLGEVEAAVCGMKHRSSILSVRAAPNTDAAELYRAPYYAIVDFTGKVSPDRKWVEISSVGRRVDINGRFLEIRDQTETPVKGWVSLRYLCAFEM